MLRGLVSFAGAALVIAVTACSSSDPAPNGGGADSGTTAAATVQCKAVPEADSFCTCTVTSEQPESPVDACASDGSANVVCCMQPGSTGAGGGKGVCGCKQVSCSEFSDGSCTCRTGDASTERPIELCQPPDEGHCCKSDDTYCTCSASECFDGDTEVPQCDPAAMAKNACSQGETKVNDCKAAFK